MVFERPVNALYSAKWGLAHDTILQNARYISKPKNSIGVWLLSSIYCTLIVAGTATASPTLDRIPVAGPLSPCIWTVPIRKDLNDRCDQ